jgi:LacI family transcriptional regulator
VKTIQFLKSNDINVVVLDRRVSGEDADIVYSDSKNGASRLTKLLIGLGHKRIAIISGNRGVSTSEDRVVGYQQALAEAGLGGSELIYYGAFNEHSGYQLANQAMMQNPRPTAIFGGNNFVAMGAIKAIHNLNMDVPGDVSVVGFDDLPEFMFMKPFLTVARQPAYDMGRLAAELLLKRITGEMTEEHREFVLPVEIVVRESSGPNKIG